MERESFQSHGLTNDFFLMEFEFKTEKRKKKSPKKSNIMKANHFETPAIVAPRNAGKF